MYILEEMFFLRIKIIIYRILGLEIGSINFIGGFLGMIVIEVIFVSIFWFLCLCSFFIGDIILYICILLV